MVSPCLGFCPARRRGLGRNAGGFRIRQENFCSASTHKYHYNATFTYNATSAKMWIMNMIEISPKLGLNLKRIRTKKKMSQGDIARALEVHRAYVSGIETGKRNPTLATIEKLANALGVTASELLK